VNPAGQGKPQCFAIRRGKIKDERIDAQYYLPKYQATIDAMGKSKYPTELLGNLVVSITGGATPLRAKTEQYAEDGIRFLRIQNIVPCGIDLSDIKYITEQVHQGELARSQLQAGDVLMTITGRIGTTAVVEQKYLPANINQHIVRIRLRTEEVRPEFLACFLNSNIGNALANRGVTGTTRIALDYHAIRQIGIPVPPKDVQAVLVKDLQAARKARDAKLAQADAMLGGIDELVLAELGLSKPAADDRLAYAVRLNGITARLNPEYYHPERVLSVRAIEQAKGTLRAARLEEIADFMRDVVKVSEGDRYLGLASIEPNTGELTGEDETAKGLAFTFRKDDVLFSRLRPYLNKVRRAEEPGKCSTEFHVIRIKKGLTYAVLPEYLACVLRSSPILAQTRRMMTGNTHPRLANADVVNLVVPIPDETVQKRIVDEVAKRKEQVRQLRAEGGSSWRTALATFEAKLIGNAGKA